MSTPTENQPELASLIELTEARGYHGRDVAILLLEVFRIGAVAFDLPEAEKHLRNRAAELMEAGPDLAPGPAAPEWTHRTKEDQEVASWRESLNHGWH